MLFNSFDFIFAFFPITVFIYFYLNRKHLTVFSNIWLVLASLFFYGYFLPKNILIMLSSILVNYAFGYQMNETKNVNKKALLTIGIIFNVLLLGYYKYANFFVDNINLLFNVNIEMETILLPLAISFFTFQQIAYLVDSYKGETKEYNFFYYSLFVSFFPQLIAGPIVHHKDIIPQFEKLKNKVVNWKNVYAGLFIFSLGLMKKVGIADKLSEFVTDGYTADNLSMIQAWYTSLCYSFQIYFDFSGYCDMAMGCALVLNIKLPVNFNSPYKALNIQDFWRRWHITLSRWLRNYIYIPLGGNRKGPLRTYINVFMVFLIGGFWHGAGWTFIIWGILHGTAVVIHRYWTTHNHKMPTWLGAFFTLFFVNIAWIYFRAESVEQAHFILKKMFDFKTFGLKELSMLAAPAGLFLFAKYWPNSMEWLAKVDGRKRWGVLTMLLLFVYVMLSYRLSEFIYFNF